MAFVAAALPLLTAASGAMSAVGSYVEAQRSAAGDEFNAEVSRRNAKLARISAESDRQDEKRNLRRKLGQIRAAYAANGTGGTGTSLDVIEDATTEGAFDLEKIRYSGELKALGLIDQANQYDASARASKASAPFSLAVGLLGSGASGFETSLRRV